MKTKEDQEEEGRKEGRRKLAVYEGLRYNQGLKVLTKAKNLCRSVY